MQFAILGLLLIAAGVFLSPYRAQRALEEAVQKTDRRAVSSLIDISSVQANTATWMQGQLGEVTPMIGSFGPINVGSVAQVFGSALLRAQMKRSLTTQVAGTLIIGVVRGAPIVHGKKSQKNNIEPLLPRLLGRYRDFSHYEFWSTNDRAAVHVVMCREYLVTWHVCGFEGKDFTSELGQEFEKWMTANARR